MRSKNYLKSILNQTQQQAQVSSSELQSTVVVDQDGNYSDFLSQINQEIADAEQTEAAALSQADAQSTAVKNYDQIEGELMQTDS